MNDFIKREYKLPNGRTVTADFDDLGIAKITIQALDAIFDILNSSDVVEVVRCKDCRYWQNYHDVMMCGLTNAMMSVSDYCSYGERGES